MGCNGVNIPNITIHGMGHSKIMKNPQIEVLLIWWQPTTWVWETRFPMGNGAQVGTLPSGHVSSLDLSSFGPNKQLQRICGASALGKRCISHELLMYPLASVMSVMLYHFSWPMRSCPYFKGSTVWSWNKWHVLSPFLYKNSTTVKSVFVSVHWNSRCGGSVTATDVRYVRFDCFPTFELKHPLASPPSFPSSRIVI